MLSSQSLIKNGILPKNITVVECNKFVFRCMNRNLGVNIVRDKIEDYITNTPQKSIDAVYFDFTGNNVSLRSFQKGIESLSRHILPEVLKISTTFSVGRRGKMTDLEIYNVCIDVMKKTFPDRVIRMNTYYSYSRKSRLRMHYRQFELVKE